MKDEGERLLQFILHPSYFILFFFPFQFDLLQERVHACAIFFDLVPHEMNLRSTRQVERKTQLLADIGSSVAEGLEREPVFFLVSGDHNKNLRVPAILGKANVCHCYHRKPRVFEFIPDNLRNLLTNDVCNSLWTTHGS